MSKENDFTSNGTRVEAQYENDRNADSKDLFKCIIREVYGTENREMDVIIGHHLSYEWREKRADGFIYTFVQEIPSADTLIFDHDVAKKLWGAQWRSIIYMLAVEPCATRDQLLAKFYNARGTPKFKQFRDETLKAAINAAGQEITAAKAVHS